MKLYRGVKSLEVTFKTQEEEEKYKKKWLRVLMLREQGDFSYPEDLNENVVELHKLNTLSYQHFTDRKDIAEYYARRGSLMEIDVSLEEILEHFTLEFQNYPKRRERFEIVYIIQSRSLLENRENWKLKIV